MSNYPSTIYIFFFLILSFTVIFNYGAAATAFQQRCVDSVVSRISLRNKFFFLRLVLATVSELGCDVQAGYRLLDPLTGPKVCACLTL